MTLIGTHIETAKVLLEDGQVIAIPTETVYGLAGNALNCDAVKKIYEIKNRPLSNPLIIHLADITQLDKYVTSVPAIAKKLAAYFWPGSLTLLLPKSDIIPDLVTSGLPNVAVRVPNHPLALQLLRSLSFPLAAPSANPFGYISPTSAENVMNILSGKISYILDGGFCETGIESTIVGFKDDKPIIYRVGAISAEDIEKVVGEVEMNHKTEIPVSPGMLPSHYAPHTPFFLINNIKELLETSPADTGLLSFTHHYSFIPEHHQEILSLTGNLDEAARNLYKAMLRLDSLKLARIVAKRVPDIGIGIAINDRLERAAYKNHKHE